MKYNVKVLWKKKPSELFTDNKYSRVHAWNFDGGAIVQGSASPQVVRLPMSDESAVDPEEAFVAAISSCHMLFFLSIAAEHQYTVDVYEDDAEGVMAKIDNGEMAMTEVTLKPNIVFSGANIPSAKQIAEIHEISHKKCYIANSVKTAIKIIQA